MGQYLSINLGYALGVTFGIFVSHGVSGIVIIILSNVGEVTFYPEEDKQLFPPKPLLSNIFSNPSRPQHEAQAQVVVASCPQAPT